MKPRVIFLDYLRMTACLMVMLVHACESYYLGGEGTLILNSTDALSVTIIDTLCRPSVPLFVLTSSFLLFPLEMETGEFFLRRIKRVLIPFIFWSLMYAIIPLYGSMYDFYKADGLWTNVSQLAFNFVGAAGHLWFVYMILGVYLIMPLLSPWAKTVSKRGEQWFLAAWAITTLVPFWRFAALHHSGLAEIFGEANWNEFGTLYYISGFIGYVVLGHYIRTYVPVGKITNTIRIALPLIIIGFCIAAGGFWTNMPHTYPYEGPLQVAITMELTWGFCTTGIALMTVGMFLLMRHIGHTGNEKTGNMETQKPTETGEALKPSDSIFYRMVVLPISRESYRMYLMHIFFLCFYVTEIRKVIDCTPLAIVLTALSSYVTSFIASWLITRLRGVTTRLL